MNQDRACPLVTLLGRASDCGAQTFSAAGRATTHAQGPTVFEGDQGFDSHSETFS